MKERAMDARFFVRHGSSVALAEMDFGQEGHAT
jgi:hypothetical protein